jgi:hypothetical protein
MNVVPIFQAVSAIFAAAAIYFFWSGSNDPAFFTLVLSLCSFFLSLRFKTKSRIEARRIEEEAVDTEQ